MSETILLDGIETASQRAAARLRVGELVVIPTDTVYAVVADAFQPAATMRLNVVREAGRIPLPVIVGSPRQVSGLVDRVPEAAERLMAAYWPGPLTLVLPSLPDLPWDLGDDRSTVALRMPADDLALAVVAEVGPLACTSGNRRGEPAPTTAEEARHQLGAAVALYIDGGVRNAAGSTVVDCTGARVQVLRERSIPATEIQLVVGALGGADGPVSKTARQGG